MMRSLPHASSRCLGHSCQACSPIPHVLAIKAASRRELLLLLQQKMPCSMHGGGSGRCMHTACRAAALAVTSSAGTSFSARTGITSTTHCTSRSSSSGNGGGGPFTRRLQATGTCLPVLNPSIPMPVHWQLATERKVLASASGSGISSAEGSDRGSSSAGMGPAADAAWLLAAVRAAAARASSGEPPDPLFMDIATAASLVHMQVGTHAMLIRMLTLFMCVATRTSLVPTSLVPTCGCVCLLCLW